MKGILLVDKPPKLTSHDVVDRVRAATGIRRIGHTGTLDPAATGLLVLCIGPATRLSEHLTGLDKIYEGTMRLGVVTDSYDIDGAITEEHPVPDIDIAQLQEACNAFIGDILQEPPMVSAVKVGGERLYKRARQGETVERKPRPVSVREFTVTGYTPPEALIRVACTSGTYVRSLCHDVGRDLGCGAILSALRRTQVGRFSVAEAHPLDDLTNQEEVAAHLIPIDSALDLPCVTVKPAGRRTVLSGGAIGPQDLATECPIDAGWIQVKTEEGRLLALARVESTPWGKRIQPKRVLAK